MWNYEIRVSALKNGDLEVLTTSLTAQSSPIKSVKSVSHLSPFKICMIWLQAQVKGFSHTQSCAISRRQEIGMQDKEVRSSEKNRLPFSHRLMTVGQEITVIALDFAPFFV